jgi:hypothetical protein
MARRYMPILHGKNEKNSLDERNLTKQTVAFCRTGNGSQHSITRSDWKRKKTESGTKAVFWPTVFSTRIRIQAFSLMQNWIRIQTRLRYFLKEKPLEKCSLDR